MKNTIRKLARRFNILLADKSRIGIELENDLRRLSHGRPLQTIFDVGANHGQSAIRFARAFKDARIYSFEPVPDNFRILSSRCAHHPRIELVPKGLGKIDAEAVIGLSDNPGGHSLLLGASAPRTVKIELTTLDGFLTERGLDSVDLLKIDVEGLELDVLAGSVHALSQGKVRFIYAECIFSADESSPHTLLSDLSDFLDPYDFVLFACYHESFNLRAGSAMGNVLLVNRSLLPASVPGKIRNIF